MFSFVDAVVLQPLPFPEPERLVQVFETYQGESLERRAVGYPTMLDWRERIGAFTGIAAVTAGDVALTEAGEAQRFIAQLVDPQLFDLLGSAPAAGRGLAAEDNQAHEQEPVAVLGHELWQAVFGGRQDIVGSTIRLNGIATTVIGIMPPEFSGPSGNARMWLPIRPGQRVTQASADVLESRGNRGLGTVARLAPGATLESAQAELDAVTLQLREEHPDTYVDRGALVVSLEEQLLGDTRDPVLILMGAVGLVLLIASANLANLTLARAAGRREEIAMRFALGAGRARLVRQLLTESTVLALMGGGVGLLLAVWRIETLITWLPFNVPAYLDVGVNGSVVLFTLAVTLATGVMFGLLPALTASRRHLARNLTAVRGACWWPARWRCRSPCWWARRCCCRALRGCARSSRDSSPRGC
jgi:predicted permease